MRGAPPSPVFRPRRAHRALVAGVLADQLERRGAPAAARQAAAALADPSSVAIVTGQQAGAFGGPLYTVLKAVTAIQLARRVAVRAQRAGRARVLGGRRRSRLGRDSDGHDARRGLQPRRGDVAVAGWRRLASGRRRWCWTIVSSRWWPRSPRRCRRPSSPRNSWRRSSGTTAQGRRLAAAFAGWIDELLGRHGLVVFDAADPRVKPAVAGLFVAGARRAGANVGARQGAGALDGRARPSAAGRAGRGRGQLVLSGRVRPTPDQDSGRRVRDRRRRVRPPKELAGRGRRASGTVQPQRDSAADRAGQAVSDDLLHRGPERARVSGAARRRVSRVRRRTAAALLPGERDHPRFTVGAIPREARRGVRVPSGAGRIGTQPPARAPASRHRSTAAFRRPSGRSPSRPRRSARRSRRSIPRSPAPSTRRSTAEGNLRHLHNKIVHASKKKDETLRRQFKRTRDLAFPGGHPQERILNVAFFANRYGDGVRATVCSRSCRSSAACHYLVTAIRQPERRARAPAKISSRTFDHEPCLPCVVRLSSVLAHAHRALGARVGIDERSRARGDRPRGDGPPERAAHARRNSLGSGCAPRSSSAGKSTAVAVLRRAAAARSAAGSPAAAPRGAAGPNDSLTISCARPNGRPWSRTSVSASSVTVTQLAGALAASRHVELGARRASPRRATRRASASRNAMRDERLQIVFGIDDVAERRVVHDLRNAPSARANAFDGSARACSSATGLRFCGMMLLTCTNPSGSRR